MSDSSSFFADAFRFFPDPLFVKDSSLRYFFVNDAFAKMIHRTPSFFIGKDDFQVLPEPVAVACRQADIAAMEKENAPELLPTETQEVFSGLDGEQTISVRRHILRDPRGKTFIFGMIRDISPNRSEAILRETLEASQIGSFEILGSGGPVKWSEGLYRILGLEPNVEASGPLFTSLVHPEDREKMVSQYGEALARKDRVLNLEYRIQRKNDGMTRWIRSTGRIEYVPKGPLYFGTSQDITDLRTSETKQKETERQLGNFLEMVEEVVWSLAWGSWLPIYTNPTAERVFGWPMADLMRAEHWSKIYPEGEGQRFLRELEFAEMSGIESFSGEYRFIHRERGERIAFIRGKIIRDGDGKPIRVDGMTSDVTEMRRTFKELEEHRQKVFALSKLNTLGELASGIGHEINTPLSTILSKIARVERSIGESAAADPGARERDARLLRESMDLIARVSQIVDGLKQLSRNRQEKDAPQAFDPAISLEQALSLSRARFSNHGFRIALVRPNAPIRCLGNATTLFQALVNLLNNAFDALEEKQEIRGRDQAAAVTLSYRRIGKRISILVMDTGIGIQEGFKPKLFEPFQTTKPEGKGTGLGLNISRRLLRAQGGDLRLVSSVLGQTEFEILLPAAD